MLPQARKPAPAAVDDPCVGCNDHTKSAKTAKARHAACLLEPFVSYRHRGTVALSALITSAGDLAFTAYVIVYD